MLIGFTLQRHNDLDGALRMLQRATGKGNALSPRDAYETEIRMGEILLAQQRYAEASLVFARGAGLAKTAADRARAFYQEGRAHELRGAGPAADRKYRQAYAAEPQGTSWAAPALLAALRLEWRAGSEPQALSLYEKLTADPKWRAEAARAALFLAASDLVRGRRDRVGSWLTKARQGGRDDRLEVDYWSGRLAELEKNGTEAVARYLDVLRADPYHPLAHAARARLAAEPLARIAAAEGRRLAGSGRLDDVYGAWLLLGRRSGGQGGATPSRADAARRPPGRALPAAGRGAGAALAALGQAPRQARGDAARARRLARWRAGDPRSFSPLRSVARLHRRPAARPWGRPRAVDRDGRGVARARPLPGPPGASAPRVPAAALPVPLPEEHPRGGGDPRGRSGPAGRRSSGRRATSTPRCSPRLRAAASSISPSATARRLAGQLNLQRLNPEDLYRPEVAITLGAAYLGALLKDFSGSSVAAVAAYGAGEPETLLWRSQCFSQEPEELYTKLGTSETRDYVRRVLTGWEMYGELY